MMQSLTLLATMGPTRPLDLFWPETLLSAAGHPSDVRRDTLAQRRDRTLACPTDHAWRTVEGVALATERLVLRPAGERDLDFYFELRNRPEILALPRREPRPRSEIEHQLRGWIQHWQEHGVGTWTVFDRKTDEPVGRVEFDPMGPGWAGLSPDAIEVGCVVHPTQWNRGTRLRRRSWPSRTVSVGSGWIGWSR